MGVGVSEREEQPLTSLIAEAHFREGDGTKDQEFQWEAACGGRMMTDGQQGYPSQVCAAHLTLGQFP